MSAHHNIQCVPWFVTWEGAVALAVEDIKVAAFAAMLSVNTRSVRVYILCKRTVYFVLPKCFTTRSYKLKPVYEDKTTKAHMIKQILSFKVTTKYF